MLHRRATREGDGPVGPRVSTESRPAAFVGELAVRGDVPAIRDELPGNGVDLDVSGCSQHDVAGCPGSL
jgi:hypothetical protein